MQWIKNGYKNLSEYVFPVSKSHFINNLYALLYLEKKKRKIIDFNHVPSRLRLNEIKELKSY